MSLHHHPPAPWTTSLLAVALFVTPVLGIVSPLALTAVCVVLGLAALAEAWQRGALSAIGWHHGSLAAILAAWALISLTWSPDPWDSGLRLLRVAVLVPAGLATLALARHTPPARHRLLLIAVVTGGAIAVALLAAEALTGNGVSAWLARSRGIEPLPDGYKSPLNRGATVLAIVLWPIIALAGRLGGRAWATALLLGTAATLIVSDSVGAHFALAMGSIAFVMVKLAPRAGMTILRAGMVAAILGAPLIAHLLPAPPASIAMAPWLGSSGHHRLAIWHFAAERIAERPVLGWGMDASRAVPGGEDIFDIVVAQPGDKTVSVVGQFMPLHPHNAALQWWLELGGIGAVLMAALWWKVSGQIGSPVVAASFASALTVAMVSYGWWQNWWQAALWLAATLCALQAGADEKADRCTSSS